MLPVQSRVQSRVVNGSRDATTPTADFAFRQPAEDHSQTQKIHNTLDLAQLCAVFWPLRYPYYGEY